MTRFIVREDYVSWEHNNQKREGFLEDYFAVYEEQNEEFSQLLERHINMPRASI